AASSGRLWRDVPARAAAACLVHSDGPAREEGGAFHDAAGSELGGRYNRSVRARPLILLIACASSLATLVGATRAQDRAGAGTAADVKTVLVSRQLAQSEQLTIGQTIRLARRADGTDARTFRIEGIFEPTPDPARLGSVPRKVRLHLP